ncbi:MAG TPA: response regulator [Candidatus Acidoferrum sp.]|nr:response regulator [Candidatus Acidoferrum sp.]
MTAASRRDARPLDVLILEDNPSDATLCLRTLETAGIRVAADQVRNANDFTRKANSYAYDVILCDFTIPGWNGLEALRFVRNSGNDVPFVFVSGTEDVMVDCIKEGATDYVLKSDLKRLPHALRRALDERELRRQQKLSEEQYRMLFESNPQPMYVIDRNTLRFLAVNEATVARYGYSRQKFLDMTILDIRPAEDIPRVLDSILKEHGPGIQQYGYWTHRTANGETINVEISTQVVTFKGVDARLVLARDVTEMWKSQEKLRHSEERFSKAFRSSPVAITISTKTDGRYVDVNEAFLRMVGYRREEVIGRGTLELKIWEQPSDRPRMIAELERAGRVVAFETVFLSKSRGRRLVQVFADVIVLDGQQYVLAITNDVTEAKSLENQMRMAQKMEAVGQLAGGLAHDFNNMLGVIIGYCDLLEGRIESEAARKDIWQIKRTGQRAATLTRQLLTFSRQQYLRSVVLNLNTTITELTQMLRSVVPAHIELTFEPEPSLGNVNADLGQIEQIVTNLVMNARDATPGGGRITIKTSNVKLDDVYARNHPKVHPGSYVVLSVSDSGSGMDPATMARIFEPFFTTKSVGEGTGLGLAMVYGAIEQAGGHIEVESEIGVGTTFKLYFPRIDAVEPTRPAVLPEQITAKAKETVLLVDDETDLREVTRELLENEGYKVLSVPDAQTAISRAAEHQGVIHVLLTDVVLTGVSGSELAKRLVASRPDIQVLYMSGYAGKFLATQDLAVSPGPLIEKPFTKETLLQQLRMVIRERSHYR